MMLFRMLLLAVLLSLLSCKSANDNLFMEREQAECMVQLIEKDDEIGKIRNHQCETLSLSQTIMNYTEAMQSIPSEDCPDAFVKAYKNHKQAWVDMIPITDKFPTMRGEMHVLFNQLEQSEASVAFKKQLAKIWATWAEVEKFVPKK